MATEKGAGVTIDVVQTGISAETDTILSDTILSDTILSDTIQQSNKSIEQRALEGMQRYYYLAKKQAWDVRALSWGKIAPVPEGTGAEVKRARRHAMWRSVVTQQLQADMIAVQCSVQLLRDAADHDARLYYTTMTQDEARHLEAWLRLANEVGGVCEPDPYLEKLGELTMNVDTIEEKIWLFQVAFEGLVIPRFHQIAKAAPGTILAEICSRLTVDDGIHHASGVCYERMLLERSTAKTKRQIERVSKEMWPMFVQHLMWRPRERAWASTSLRARDVELVRGQRNEVLKMAAEYDMDLDLEL
jgi:hypothetical protein